MLHFCFPHLELFQGIYNGFYLEVTDKKYVFIAESKEEASKWYKALKLNALVVLKDITEEYTFGRMIGQGYYGKVRLGISKANCETYAIKSVSKARLCKNSKSIVYFPAISTR